MAPLTHLTPTEIGIRLAGLMLIGTLFLFVDPQRSTLELIGFPLGMAVGAYLLLRSALAVALGTALMSFAHLERGSDLQFWILGVIGTFATLVVIKLVLQRLRTDREKARARRLQLVQQNPHKQE